MEEFLIAKGQAQKKAKGQIGKEAGKKAKAGGNINSKNGEDQVKVDEGNFILFSIIYDGLRGKI